MFYWLYKRRIGSRSYSSTADTLLMAFYTNKTKQHLQKSTYHRCHLYIHVLSLDETWSVAYNLRETQTCNVIIFFNFSVAKSSKACGKRRKTLKSWNAATSKYIQLVFWCTKEKLLIFYMCEIWVEWCEVLVKEAAEHNLFSDVKRDIPKFATVLLQAYFAQTGATYDENTEAKFQQT